MSRTAAVRSVSLTPQELDLANELSDILAGGSFTELVRMWLRVFGGPLKDKIEELRESGLDPHEHLFVTRSTPPDTETQIRDFYAPANHARTWKGQS